MIIIQDEKNSGEIKYGVKFEFKLLNIKIKKYKIQRWSTLNEFVTFDKVPKCYMCMYINDNRIQLHHIGLD